MCIGAAGARKGILVAGSTGVETDRYGMVQWPDKSRHEFAQMSEGMFGPRWSGATICTAGFARAQNQRRFGLFKAARWDVEALNRLMHAAKLGIRVAYPCGLFTRQPPIYGNLYTHDVGYNAMWMRHGLPVRSICVVSYLERSVGHKTVSMDKISRQSPFMRTILIGWNRS